MNNIIKWVTFSSTCSTYTIIYVACSNMGIYKVENVRNPEKGIVIRKTDTNSIVLVHEL
jgi:hypothetical protein